jgi:hypothetical protein
MGDQLPPGFTLDADVAPQSATLPEGFTVDSPIQQQAPQPAAQPSMADMFDRYRAGEFNPKQSAAFMELMSRNLRGPQGLGAPTEARGIGAGPQLVEGRQMTDLLEPLATMATGAAAEPIAGIAGIAQGLNPFAEPGAAARAVEATSEALTYQPRTEGGQAALKGVAGALAPVGEAIQTVEKGLGDFTFNLTGSPTLAAAAASAPTLVSELLGLKGLKSLRTGTRLLDSSGGPTKILRKEFDKLGLDFDSLQPEVKEMIPETVGPDLLPGSTPIKREVESALVEQIKAGGRDDALATLKVEGNRVKTDKAGVEAVKQGFRPGFVQSVKTATPETKKKMLEMARAMRQTKKSEILGVRMRPDDVVGESITDRITFIRDKANVAKKELDDIARNKLAGVDIDGTNVLDTLENEMYDLDVRLVPDETGLPKPEFKGSLISKDRSSQKVIRDLMDLLAEGGKPDALRFHKLKRQLDIMIDFNKKSSMGLSDAGKNVLKTVRRSLNDSLREIDPDYARVNDVLSTSLGSINDLDKAVGTIDIFGTGAEKALGTRMRALLSNQQGRVKIENALDQINETTQKLGGEFTDDIKDLVMFSDGLNSRFGTAAKTSLAGQVEQAVGTAVTRPPRASVVEAIGKGVGKGAEKLRGITDFNAFESLESLLKQTNGATK